MHCFFVICIILLFCEDILLLYKVNNCRLLFSNRFGLEMFTLSTRLEFLSLLRKDLWTNFYTVNHCHCRRKTCHIKPYLSSFFTLEIIIDCNCFFIIYLPHKSLSIKTVPFFIIFYINHTWFWSCFFSLFAAEIIFNSNCTFLFYLLRKALSNCAVLFLLFAAGIIVKLNRTILLNLPRDS